MKIRKISPSGILLIIVFAVLMPPQGYSSVLPGFISTAITGLQMLAFVFSVFLMLKNNFYTKTMCVVFLFIIYLYFGGYLFRDLSINTKPFITIALINYIFYYFRHKRKVLLTSITVYFEIILIIGLVVRLAMPSLFQYGVGDSYWWFGHKNYPVRLLLPLLCFSMLRSIDINGVFFSRRVIADTVMTGLTVILSRSSTGIIGFAFFLVFTILYQEKSLPTFFSIRNAVFASMIVFCLIYFLNIQVLFEFLIVNILGKGLDFTGRTYIWDRAFELIKENPMWGVGVYYEVGKDFLLHTGHAHQYWLQNLIEGGIAGTAILLLSYLQANREIKKKSDLPGARVIIITICSFLLMGIDEALVAAPMLLPLIAFAGIYNQKEKKHIAPEAGHDNRIIRNRKIRKKLR